MANQVLYGFYNYRDMLGQRVATIGTDAISVARDQSLAEHNRQMDALFGLFVEPTTQYSARYYLGGTARLQPLDSNGRARPIKLAGYYDVAWPIQMGGSAWGANFVDRAKMTIQEANDLTALMFDADRRWMRDHMLAALLTNVTWPFNDDLKGALTIQPLANGDTTTYLIVNGADAGATDTHFLAQAAAIADAANPFPTIYTELTEHPENGGEVIALVPTNLLGAIQNLTNFLPVADPNVQLGVTTRQLIGSLGGMALPGPLRGYTDRCWIVEWPSLPDNYIVALTTNGTPPLRMRQDEEAELQGYKQVAEREDHPFWEAQFARRAGFGAYNRVGAVVQRIGNAAYAIPSGYASPMS